MSKVSALTAASTPLDGTETVYVVQSGESRRTTAADVAATANTSNWADVTLANSWVAHADWSGQVPQYRKVGGVVELRGLVENGTLAAAIFTLPSGHRPEAPEDFVVSTVGDDGSFVPAFLSISTAGVVMVERGSTDRVSLSGVRFKSA